MEKKELSITKAIKRHEQLLKVCAELEPEPESELTQLRAENDRLIQALRIAIKEKYQLSKREQSFVERMQNEGKPLPEQIEKRAMAYLKICSIVGSKVWSI
jgi:F0F1-type ATP synthase membrane subunit b/b'